MRHRHADVLVRHLPLPGKPVLGDWRAGHDTPNRALPMGSVCGSTAQAGSLVLLEDVAVRRDSLHPASTDGLFLAVGQVARSLVLDKRAAQSHGQVPPRQDVGGRIGRRLACPSRRHRRRRPSATQVLTWIIGSSTARTPRASFVAAPHRQGPALTRRVPSADNRRMNAHGIDFTALRRALGWLTEALALWHAQAEGSVLKPHLRSAVIQSFEFTYELSLRSLRRVLIERAGSVERVTDLSFNELLRSAADAGLLPDVAAWRSWRELRNATSLAYDEA